MTETTKLDLNFSNELGRSKKLSVREPKPNLTEAEVLEAMEAIVDARISETDGVINYYDIRGARYVTTAVEDVFEVE